MKYFFYTVIALLFLVSEALPAIAGDCALDRIEEMRLRGELNKASQLLTTAIRQADLAPDCRIEQHLEMARILSRTGLHQGTRPVVQALTHVDLAAELLDTASAYSHALVELAYAKYYYRAEMGEHKFPKAEDHARRATKLFANIDDGDNYGHADAVHQHGLIEFQRHNLDSAEALFKESLRLDIAAGERTHFRGEYERHIGFVHYRRGDLPAVVGHFERSLQARREAGAIDASLFAAVSLASALIESGRQDEAKPYLDYARDIARRINSPVGLERVEREMAQLATQPVGHVQAVDQTAN